MSEEIWNAVDAYFEPVVKQDLALEEAIAASASAGLPPIQVAPNQGKLLHLIAKIRGARTILEVGTLGGYSTIWLARALPPDGRLISLEIDPKHADVARKNLARAGVDNAEVRVGPASETLRILKDEKLPPFDLTFIDADKPGNLDYFLAALELSKAGSVIIVDNVVRAGKVADPASQDAAVRGVHRLRDHVATEARVSATALQTVGSKGYDGFLLAVVL